MKRRKLFCEINPLTYQLSVNKNKLQRYLRQLVDGRRYASQYSTDCLPVVIYRHKSLIRRRLGNVNHQLQENKATNLRLAAEKVDKLLIGPGEIFSFWKTVGSCTAKKGYLKGLIIKGGQTESGVGGGMCQFTNLIHWMVLHSPLTIVEHHHHNALDLFPDYKRQLPFGCGTSIMHNYLDYQVENWTDQAFQLVVWTDDSHLCGELRAEKSLMRSYHIIEENHFFSQQGADYYRHNEIYRQVIDKATGLTEMKQLIIKNRSKVMYDQSFIAKDQIRSLAMDEVSEGGTVDS